MMDFNVRDVMDLVLDHTAQAPTCFIPLILIAIIYLYKKKKNIQPSMGHLKGLFIVLILSILYTIEFPIYFTPLVPIGIIYLYIMKRKIRAPIWYLNVFIFVLILFTINTFWGPYYGHGPLSLDETYTQFFLRALFTYSYFLCIFYLLLVVQRRCLRICLYFLCFLPHLYVLYFFVEGGSGICGYLTGHVIICLPPAGVSVSEAIGYSSSPIGGMIDTILRPLFLIVLIVTAILEAIRFHRQKKSMKQQDKLLQDHQEDDETTKTDKS